MHSKPSSEEEILFSLNENYRQCKECKEWFDKNKNIEIYKRCGFYRDPCLSCFVCNWLFVQCEDKMKEGGITVKDLEILFLNRYTLKYSPNGFIKKVKQVNER